jgi:hypothetical protein
MPIPEASSRRLRLVLDVVVHRATTNLRIKGVGVLGRDLRTDGRRAQWDRATPDAPVPGNVFASLTTRSLTDVLQDWVESKVGA